MEKRWNPLGKKKRRKLRKKSENEQNSPAEAGPTHCSEGPKARGISFSDNALIIFPLLPYPQWFQKKKLDTQFSKFLEIFKKIHINILFVDALEQMSNYVKFMKDVMAKKGKLEDYETVKLTEQCSTILQRKLP